MKIAARKPKAQGLVSDNVIQEQPRRESLMSKRRESLAEYMNRTVNGVEKGMNKVDRLHIFAPCIAPTRLVLKAGLYSTEKVYRILECRTKVSYHNLVVKSTENDTMVVQDSSTGAVVAATERTGEKPYVTYTIFKTSPTHEDQTPTMIAEGQSLYALAKVERSTKHLQVIMEQQTEPTYTIEKAGIPANYATNYFIKQVGVKEELASTHPWEGTDVMLVVNPGVDAIFMFCLAAITDDAEFHRTRRESFSEMMDKLNHSKLPRKMPSSSSEGDKQQQGKSSQ